MVSYSFFSPAFIARSQQHLREERIRRERNRRALRVSYPRADESWVEAEDRRLLRLVAHYVPPHGLRYKRWWDIGQKLGRTAAAVQTRYYALKAGMRLNKE